MLDTYRHGSYYRAMKALVRLALICGLVSALHAADGDRFFPLTLEAFGGKNFASYPSDQPWSSIPTDRQTFGGVPFQIVAKFQLQGTGDARDGRFYPTRGTGLSVGRRASRLHVLHGANMSDRDGRPIASIHINYVGGHTHQLFLAYGVHTLDWWKHRGEAVNRISDTNSAEVWTGTSESATKQGSSHRLFKTSYDLPARAEAVESIDLFTLFGRASVVFVAITVEEPGAEPPAARAAAPSENDALYRDEVIAVVRGPSNEPLGGARMRGSAYDQNNALTLLGKMDDSGEELGVVPVDFPAGAQRLSLQVSASGCATKEVAMVSGPDGKLPRQLAVRLERGARISGLVKDREGAPVAKAKVEILGRTPNPTARASTTSFTYEEITTDSQGRWRSTSVPASLENVSFKVTRTDFRPALLEVANESGKNSVGRTELLEGRAEFRLAPFSSVNGIVRDASGRPVSQAKVSLSRAGRSRSTTQTDAEGRFTYNDAGASNATLVVQHPSFAPLIRSIQEDEDVDALTLTLTAGTPLRGRVVRSAGAASAAVFRGVLPAATSSSTNTVPIQGATVVVTSIESTLVRWTNTTDAAGRFVWSNAPAGPLRVTTRYSGFSSPLMTVQAGGDEITFPLGSAYGGQTAVTLLGRVIDADTGQPIPAFTVTPGENSSPDRMSWHAENSFKGTAGDFTLVNPGNGYTGSRFLAKIEAPGYWPALTRGTNSEGRTNLIVLRRGTNPKGTVKLPSGQPAAGAQVAVTGEAYLALGKGALINRSGPRDSSVVTADAAGRFELPMRLSQRVIAVHPEGYAETTLSNLALHGEITLEPYGTVEGVVMIGSRPATNAEVKLNESRQNAEVQYEYGVFDIKSDEQGRFRFTYVPPGPRWLIRLIPTQRNSRAWSHQTPVTVASGQTARATIGGTGRNVIGKVATSDASLKIDWLNGSHTLSTRLTPPSFRTGEEYEAWSASPAGRAEQDKHRSFAVILAADGTFRAEDVPAGSYRMYLSFYEPRETDARNGGVSFGPHIGSVTHQFEIEPIPGGRSDEPLDLGTLELRGRITRR